MPRLLMLLVLLGACGKDDEAAKTSSLPVLEDPPPCGDGSPPPDVGTEPPPDGGGAEPEVKFKSVFWAKTNRDGEEVILPIRDRAVLESGTPLGWMIEKPQSLHVYVVYRSADNEYALLYPNELGGGHVLEYGTKLDDNTGIERFFMVASRAPLGLDGLAGDELADAVRKLRKDHEVKHNRSARPAPIGGAVRAGSPGDHAIWYEAEETGCWTFTIDHR